MVTLMTLLVASALGTDVVDVSPGTVSLKTRHAWPSLPASVESSEICVVGVTIDSAGTPLVVDAGTCREELALAAREALMVWRWYGPNLPDGAQARFPLRLEFNPVLLLPRELDPGWALNQALVTFAQLPDGAPETCRMSATIHPDGALSALTSNDDGGVCRLLPSSPRVRPPRSAVRSMEADGDACVADFAARDKVATDLEVTGCAEDLAVATARMVSRWRWFDGTYNVTLTFTPTDPL